MNPISGAFASRKFIVALAGVVVAGLLRLGLNVPIEDVITILSPLTAYVLAQGLADHGKAAKKVEAVGRVVERDSHMDTKETIEAIKTT